MGTLYAITQSAIPSGGLQIPLGPGLKFWLSIAVNTYAGQQVGTNVVLTVTGRRPREIITINYGSPQTTRQFEGNLVNVTGTGASIELTISTSKVDVTPVNLPSLVTANTVTYVDNGTAPFTGVWTVSVETPASPSGPIQITDGTYTDVVVPTGSVPPSQLLTFKFAVTGGLTYHITGATFRRGSVGGA